MNWAFKHHPTRVNICLEPVVHVLEPHLMVGLIDGLMNLIEVCIGKGILGSNAKVM